MGLVLLHDHVRAWTYLVNIWWHGLVRQLSLKAIIERRLDLFVDLVCAFLDEMYDPIHVGNLAH